MRAMITLLGADKPGIIAAVSGAVFEGGGNILDISQTVMRDDYFVMIMLVEIPEDEDCFAGFKQTLEDCAAKIDMEIKIHREEVFRSMHRV